MVKDAEKFADEDKKKREAVDVKNQVCYFSYQYRCWCGFYPYKHMGIGSLVVFAVPLWHETSCT